MKILLISALTLSLNLSCSNIKPASQQENLPKNTRKVVAKDTSHNPDNQRFTKYGFVFQIPKHWQIQTNDFETKNIKGEVKSIETVYVDNKTQSHIRLLYHPGTAGSILYRYYSEELSEKTKKTTIAQQNAIKFDEILTRDGKGHLLSKPVIRHKIYILSPVKKGVLEIVYDVPENDAKASQVYNNFMENIQTAN